MDEDVAVVIGIGGMGRAIARRIGSGRAVLLVDGGVVAAFHTSAAVG